MTPEERAERSKEQLRGMSGQRYLFEDTGAGDSVPTLLITPISSPV
jgi:hypothetical protein